MSRYAIGVALILGCATSHISKGDAVAPFAREGVTAAAARPLRHALLVGIDAFQDERFTTLHYASADALALGGALSDFDDLRVLVHPAETTRSVILAELAALEERLRTPSDTVVIYFSTHGSLGREPGGELKRFLVAADTRMDLMLETGISVDTLVRKADRFRSRRVLLVLAACHSGKGKSQIPDDLAHALAMRKAGGPPPLEQVSEAVIVLTAAAFGESAREDEALAHDVYTYFLLRALDEGDRDGDGAVTASEAHDYARERTYTHTGGQQRPTSESTVLGRDPIILRGQPTRTGRPVLYSYAPSAEGIAVLVNGVHKGTLPGGIALQPGSHKLRLADEHDGHVLYDGDVDVRAGEHLDISRLVRQQGVRVAAEAGFGALIPFSSAMRAALPTLLLAVARLHVCGYPRNWVRAELQAAFMTGSGEEPNVAGASVPFRTNGAYLALGLGAEVPLGDRFFVGGAAGPGVMLLSRYYLGSFIGHQSLRATTASASVETGWIPSDRLRLGTRLEAIAVFGRIGGSSGPHRALLPSVSATFSF